MMLLVDTEEPVNVSSVRPSAAFAGGVIFRRDIVDRAQRLNVRITLSMKYGMYSALNMS